MTDTAETSSTSTEASETDSTVDTNSTVETDTSTETEETNAAEQTDNRPEPEAKKYRKRAQDAEAERDALRSRVDALLRNEATRVIQSLPDTLHNPADLFEIGGITIENLQDDDGMINSAKVAQALADLREQRAYLFTERKPVRIGAGEHESLTSSTTWQKALKR